MRAKMEEFDGDVESLGDRSATWHSKGVLHLALLLALQQGVDLQSVDVAGEVVDVAEGRDGAVVAVSATVGNARKLTLIDTATKKASAGPSVPSSATAYAVCGGGVVFVDDKGLVDDKGARLIAKTPLLSVADPQALLSGDLCPGEKNERMLVVKDGIVVVSLGDDGAVAGERVLSFAARARAYPGRAQHALRGERSYAQALSLYAPRLFAVDVDGDGDRDLVAFHDGRLVVYRRAAGVLSTTGEQRDLHALVGASPTTQGDADLRVRFHEVKDGCLAVVSVSRGAVPESSKVVVVDGTADQPFSRVKETRSYEGLAQLLGVVGDDIVVGQIDTSLVALSGVLLTGKLTVKVKVKDEDKASLTAAADIRGGKMDGALPIVDVDLDKDGVADLVDLGVPGSAVVFKGAVDRGGALGFSESKRLTVPRFTIVAPLPSSSSVALVSQPAKQKAKLSFIGR